MFAAFADDKSRRDACFFLSSHARFPVAGKDACDPGAHAPLSYRINGSS